MNPKINYIFLIHTDQYAGNFERELCAWVTGQLGDSDVGEGYVDSKIERKFRYKIEHRVDEHGADPCAIWQNFKGNYNSVAIFFHKKPAAKDITLLTTRAMLFPSVWKEYSGRGNSLEIVGFELLEETTSYRKIEI